MRDRTKRKIVVEIDNLTEAQEIALNDLFATWERLGSMGSSRWTAFYADGDGDFRPKITINGEKPKFTDLIPREEMWHRDEFTAKSFLITGDAYKIDFDWIAWKLSEKDEKENPSPPYVQKPVDWSKPHHIMLPEGWNSRHCPDCGKDVMDPVHIIEVSESENES